MSRAGVLDVRRVIFLQDIAKSSFATFQFEKMSMFFSDLSTHGAPAQDSVKTPAGLTCESRVQAIILEQWQSSDSQGFERPSIHYFFPFFTDIYASRIQKLRALFFLASHILFFLVLK